MYWNKLLNPIRQRQTPTFEQSEHDNRSPFKKDFDTICNSTILRRLQDKAQVFPLENEDYARTRLTHSIEVMSIAESLGMQAIEVIKDPKNKRYLCADDSLETDTIGLVNDIPTILKTVALLHDMGNPPFGHLGEQIIRDWFRDNLGKYSFNNDGMLGYKNNTEPEDTLGYILKGRRQDDLVNFNGNAQLFRFVNKLSFVVDEYGMNLTYPVMAAFVKYPTSSLNIGENGTFSKKIGYFHSESNIYDSINKDLGLKGKRHPLAFLLEAADDIAYLTADIEDAHKKGLITLNSIKQYFEENQDDAFIKTILCEMEKYQIKADELNYCEVETYVMHRTRVLIKGLMIDSIYSAFINAYSEIMTGNFENELIKISSAAKIAEVLQIIETENIHYSQQIVYNKTRSFVVIEQLLNAFVPAIINWDKTIDDGKDTTNNLIYQSFSKNYKYICDCANENTTDIKDKIYNKLLLVTDQISGMTDTHALSVYHRLIAD
jgi:dGTPase